MPRPTDDQIKRLIAMVNDREPITAIGEALGISRNAVSGIVFRLRQNGDQRIRPAGRSATADLAKSRRDQMDRLTESMAQGASSMRSAAIRVGISQERAHDLWRAIRAQLGWQAV